MTSLTFQISFLFDVAINTNHLFLIFFFVFGIRGLVALHTIVIVATIRVLVFFWCVSVDVFGEVFF